MANRGERAPERSDAMLPIALGCAALMVVMCGGGGLVAYAYLRAVDQASGIIGATAPIVPATPVAVPTPAPVLPAPVSAPEPPATDVGHGGSGFYDPSATPDPDPQAVTIHEGAEVSGALSPEVIRRVVLRHIAEVRGCYEHALATDPGLTARVVAHFTIGPDGRVTAATVDGSSDAALTTCIASRVRAWVFPTPAGGGTVRVNYPFVLTAS